jgi:hypothetical protein
MRKFILLAVAFFIAVNSFAQNTEIHYIKFFHVGEQIDPVPTLNITFREGAVPKDKYEAVLDTTAAKTIVTDEKSYNAVLNYINSTHLPYEKTGLNLSFGTFKIINDGKYFYLPSSYSATYLKNLVAYLKKKKADEPLIDGIAANYTLFLK